MNEKVFLLADDDSDDTEMFLEALREIENTIICHCVVDGSEALKKLDDLTTKPHLIFLDVNMPVMSGWQCLKILKKDERYKEIPVFIISTSSHEREIDIAEDLGALCYLTKPNDFNELKEVLRVITNNLDAGLLQAMQNVQANSPLVYTCNRSGE